MVCLCTKLIALALALGTAAEPAAAPQVELTTLSGRRLSGPLLELSVDHARLKSAGKEASIPLAEILELRIVRSRPAAPADHRRPELVLTDGSRIYWTALKTADRQIQVEAPLLGKASIPLAAAASVRLAALDPVLADAWKDLAAREIKQDMLVIRKGNVLDHLDGTVGAIDSASIRFVIDGEDVSLKREKVFGIVYARRNPEAGKPMCDVLTTNGDVLKAQSAAWSGERLKLGLLGGAVAAVPADQVLSLDFSAGKVRYLSELEPREAKYTLYFGDNWTDEQKQRWLFWRDRPRDGGTLRLGNKEYSRGLWIHSRTLLKYRLSGDYRRFQAVMGIDQAVAPLGNVHVVISGDGKALLESDVRGADPPQYLDLDVAGIRELEILVDFGGDLDIADHLDLADAKVIK